MRSDGLSEKYSELSYEWFDPTYQKTSAPRLNLITQFALSKRITLTLSISKLKRSSIM